MHKLTRPWPEPTALGKARSTAGMNWDDLDILDRDSIRDALLDMQAHRCAYCECSLKGQIDGAGDVQRQVWNGHIEHFRRKQSSFHPELTFDWNNLFYTCLSDGRCGNYKDQFIKNKAQYQKLIDPCLDNPEAFLVFSSNGLIAVRSGLSSADRTRAEFTILAFNLNAPRLVQRRKELLKGYKWLQTCPDEDQICCLSTMKTDGTPFITAISHVLGKRVCSP